jgi:zinc/manganese transport system permease protein
MEIVSVLAGPLIACVLLVLILPYFGLHILERGIIFVDLALAQFIGIGIALSFLLDMHDSYALPLGFAALGAMMMALSRKLERQVNIEAFIGVLYIFSLSVSILILDRSPHGMEEFKEILNGSILWVTPSQLFYTFLVFSAAGLLHGTFRRRFLALSYERQGGFFIELLFFLSFAAVLVKAVEIAGVVQVFAFLVVPALIGRLFSRRPLPILLIAWSAGVATSAAGVALSFVWDLPTSPLIVSGLTAVFLLLLTAGTWNGRGRPVRK